MFFGSNSAVAVMNINNNFEGWNSFKKTLRKGYFIISELKGFTKEQMEILIKEHRDVEQFMNDDNFTDFIDYSYKAIDDKSFYIHCQRNAVGKFVNRAFDYLKMNECV